MQVTSALYNKLLVQENHWFETKVIVDETEYTEAQVYSVSTSISAFEKEPEIGKAVAQEVNCVIVNPGRDFPRMARIEVYVRAVGVLSAGTTGAFVGDTLALSGYSSFVNDTLTFWSDSAVAFNNDTLTISNQTDLGVSEWLPQGVFYADTKEFTKNDGGIVKCTLHGYDAIMKAESPYDSSDLDFSGDGALDTTVVNEIAAKIGVSVDSRTYEVMRYGYKIPLPTNYSLREILSIIAAKYLGVFIITEQGKLMLQSLISLPPDTSMLITEHGNYITFGGVRIIING